MRIVLHAGAAADIESSASWYEERREGLGEEFVEEVSRAFEAIALTPRTWPTWPGAWRTVEIRRFALARFPFGVAYRILEIASRYLLSPTPRGALATGSCGSMKRRDATERGGADETRFQARRTGGPTQRPARNGGTDAEERSDEVPGHS